MTDDGQSQAGTEATPEPEGPPQRPTRQVDGNIWEDDGSLSSLPPMPSPLDYSASATGTTPLGGVFCMSDDASLFSDKSLEDRLHRTLNQNISGAGGAEHRYPKMTLEPTLEVARLVQQVEMLRGTNQDLRNENKLLIVGGQALEMQKEKLVEARVTAELREREARQESASLERKLEQANAQLNVRDKEIQQLQAQLEKLSTELESQQERERAVVKQAQEEARREISILSNKNASLEREQIAMAKVLEETQILLDKATVECTARKPSTDIGVQTESEQAQSNKFVGMETDHDVITSGREAKPKMNNIEDLEALVSMTANPKSNPSENLSDTLPIGERLCRIRDAAERASLVKEHQREIARLSTKHEAELQQLLERFEKEKDTLLEEAMSEMNAGYKGLRRRLELEHEKKMEKAERQYRKELDHIREEADNATAAATESVEVAMAQVASANQRCQREIKRREASEARLDQLQEEFDAQKRALADLSKLGHGWETERKNLVDTLQRECNSVFDRTKSASPHSVTTEFFADIEAAERQRALSPLGERASVNSEIRSPTFTELDRTLRETEAFVEKVLSS